MGTGIRGTYVIPWSHTAIDGAPSDDISALETGAEWSWTGDALRVDGPNTVLRLGHSAASQNLHRHAARRISHIFGHRQDKPVLDDLDIDARANWFTLTDGRRSYAGEVIERDSASQNLLAFRDCVPPQNTELWVVHPPERARHSSAIPKLRMTGFAFGTLVDTTQGPCPIEDLKLGDLIVTRDAGPQPLTWISAKRLSAARLFMLPHLRPVRFDSMSVQAKAPIAPLLCAPDQSLVLGNDATSALFNDDAVASAARYHVNKDSITSSLTRKPVTYVNIMLPDHHVIRANGLDVTSFHPAQTDLANVPSADLAQLFAIHPAIKSDTMSFGRFVCRTLTAPEIAIFKHSA